MFANIRNGVALIILVSAPFSYGQTTVWLSDNATFADLDLTTASPPETTGSFGIWVRTHELDRLQFVTFDLTNMGGAIELTRAEIVIGRERFGEYTEPIVAHDGSLITNISAFALPRPGGGIGIGPGVPVDDEVLDAYRFATINYRVAALGISELQLRVGPWLIGCPCPLPHMGLHLGIDDPISNNVVEGATDAIVDGKIQAVPEPDSLILLIVGGFLPSSARIARLA